MPDELPLGRMEAFSDGVFAIAITLLVLELGVPAGSGDDLLGAILDQWPSYLAYITSFLTIGVIWLEHSAITGALRGADATLYRLNLLVLLLASFLPFPTKLTAEFIHERGRCAGRGRLLRTGPSRTTHPRTSNRRELGKSEGRIPAYLVKRRALLVASAAHP